MLEIEYKNLTEIIVEKYRKEMRIFYHPTLEGGEAYIDNKLVFLEARYRDKPNEWSVFTTLHEIGHIKTNNNKQKRCVQEYLATQWAIDESKKYGLELSKLTLTTYQKYIWKFRKDSERRKCKNLPTEAELTLKY